MIANAKRVNASEEYVAVTSIPVPPNHDLGSNDSKRVAGLRKQVADPTQNDLIDGKK